MFFEKFIKEFENKTILITGATSGIGLMVSDLLIGLNSKLILLGRDSLKLEKIFGRKKLQNVNLYSADFRDLNKLKIVLDEIGNKFEKIDGLVNSAGVVYTEDFIHFKEHEWDDLINVNLKSVFLITQKVSKIMKKNNFGSIVNISSIDAIKPPENFPSIAYNSSKAALISLTKSIAVELGKYNIRANIVIPGLIKTPMTEDFFKKEFESERARFLERVPLKRAGETEEVAFLILFLLSFFSSYTTGETIFVDGGFNLS